jgi:hypothetical protein
MPASLIRMGRHLAPRSEKFGNHTAMVDVQAGRNSLAALPETQNGGGFVTVKEVIKTSGDILKAEPVRTQPKTALLRGTSGVANVSKRGILTANVTKAALPKAWDWRQELAGMGPPGYDGLGEQFSQGNCGSCYAFSGAMVLQMRFRIRLLQTHGILYPLELSWKSATRCSPYTEGCSGGFAYLTFKQAAEVGLPTADCDKAEDPATLDNSCDWACYKKGTDLFYAKSYGFVDGFSHGASEEGIMREIHDNGPVILSFSTTAAPEFIYNNGKSAVANTTVMTFFKNDEVPTEKSSQNPEINDWMYTTHSILAVGYGEEVKPDGEVVKYWIVRNSWGQDWGQQGYAKMRRGHNDAALETASPWPEPDMDRLPAGFLEKAKKYHEEHNAHRADVQAHVQPALAEGKGGRPAYCKLRPDSPDCQ